MPAGGGTYGKSKSIGTPKIIVVNSLEATKVVISVLQIIATATVSVALAMATLSFQKESQKTSRADTERQNKKIAADARQAMIDAKTRADQAKIETDNQNKAAREDANRREELADKEARAREIADRRLADENAKFERVVLKRVALWEDLAPNINDIYSYLLYVGKWKEFTAADMVKRKRDCDKAVYSDRFYLSDEFFAAYTDFMAQAFRTGNAMGTDAQPQTSTFYRVEADRGAVTGKDNAEAVHRAYYRLQAVAAHELNLRITPPTQPPPPDKRS